MDESNNAPRSVNWPGFYRYKLINKIMTFKKFKEAVKAKSNGHHWSARQEENGHGTVTFTAYLAKYSDNRIIEGKSPEHVLSLIKLREKYGD